MSKTNTIVASDSSTSDDMRELEIAWVCCAREGLKPHYHTFFFFVQTKTAGSQSQARFMSQSRPHELGVNCGIWFMIHRTWLGSTTQTNCRSRCVCSCRKYEQCWEKCILIVNVHSRLFGKNMWEYFWQSGSANGVRMNKEILWCPHFCFYCPGLLGYCSLAETLLVILFYNVHNFDCGTLGLKSFVFKEKEKLGLNIVLPHCYAAFKIWCTGIKV